MRIGCALDRWLSPAVEYRTWPIASRPGRPDSVCTSNGVGDVAHRAGEPHLLPIRGGDARALLSAMLESVETEVGHVGRFGMAEDAEDAALVFELIQHASLSKIRRPGV